MPTATFEESFEAFRNPGKGWRNYVQPNGVGLNNDLDLTDLSSVAHCPKIPWAAVHLALGSYDWSLVDQMVEVWGVERGLEVSIGITGMSKTSAYDPDPDNVWGDFPGKPQAFPAWAQAQLVANNVNGLGAGGEFTVAGIFEPNYADPYFVTVCQDLCAGFRAAWDASPDWQRWIKYVDVKLFGSGGGEGKTSYPWRLSNFGIRFQKPSDTGAEMTLKVGEFRVDNLGDETAAIDPPHVWVDTFTRTVTDNWGHSETGAYTPKTGLVIPELQVHDGYGHIIIGGSGDASERVTATQASEDEVDMLMSFSIDRLPTGSGAQALVRQFCRRRLSSSANLFPTSRWTLSTEDGNSVTSHTIGFEDLPVANDVIVAFALVEAGASIGWPAGWTELAETQDTRTLAIAWKRMSGGEASVVVTTSIASKMIALIFDFEGVYTTGTPVEISAVHTDSGPNSANAPDLTPSWGSGSTLWLAAASFDEMILPADVEAPDGWGDPLQERSLPADSNDTLAVSTLSEEASHENPGNFLHDAANSIAYTLALRSDLDSTITNYDYGARTQISTTGAVSLVGRKTVADVESNVGSVISGLGTLVPGDLWWQRCRVSGHTPTSIKAKAWKDGTAEPGSWQVDTTDSTGGVLQRTLGDERYQILRPIQDAWPDAFAGAENPPALHGVSGGSLFLGTGRDYLQERDVQAVVHAVEERGVQLVRRNVGQPDKRFDVYPGPDEPIFWNANINDRAFQGEWGTKGLRVWLTGHNPIGTPGTGNCPIQLAIEDALRWRMDWLGWWVNRVTAFKVTDMLSVDFDYATWFPEAIPYVDAYLANPIPANDHQFSGFGPMDHLEVNRDAASVPDFLRPDGESENLRDYYQRSSGYRLYLAEAVWPNGTLPGGTVQLALNWHQRGSGKLYRHHDLRARLKADLLTFDLGVSTAFDAEDWPVGPGGAYLTEPSFVLPGGMVADAYELQIAVVDEDGEPAINLANEGKDTTGLADPINDPGYYTLGTLTVGSGIPATTGTTVSVVDSFMPAGTTVRAYRLSDVDAYRRVAAAPQGDPEATGTIVDEAVTFEGLDRDVTYALYGDVAGEARYVVFAGIR